MKGMRGGMAQFIKQANQMQSKINKIKEDLDSREFEASSGGEAVKVIVTGAGSISNLTIQPEVLEDNDVEMLQDLILTAANEALKAAQTTRDKEMEKVTGGMSLPGLGI